MQKKMRLTALREERGLSKSKLAMLAQVNYSLLCRFESRQSVPYPKAARALAEVLDWQGEPSELFEEIEVS